jgi:Tol biopolymer transport system component
MPDDRRLAFVAQGGVRTVMVDGSGVAESLLVSPSPSIQEIQISRDRQTLLYRDGPGGNRDIWRVHLDSANAVQPVLRTPFDERGIALSPDGRWLAYVSNEVGPDEVFVRQLAQGSGRWRVSQQGGTEPRWGPGGRELFFRVADSVFVVDFAAGPEPRFTQARRILVGSYDNDRNRVSWDVSPDGQRFVFTRAQNESSVLGLNVVMHWFDQLRGGAR